MNKILKSTYILLMGLLGIGLASCTEEFEYQGASVEGMQVYFSNELSSKVELEENATSFKIPVNRVEATEAATVPITFTPGEGNIFTVPASVTFEAGQNVAYITVTYDPTAVKYGQYVGGTVAIAEEGYTTVYGKTSYTFNAGITDFVEMEGWGYFRDDIALPLYGLDVSVYQVKIEKSIMKEGVYRLRPFGAYSHFQYNGNVNPDRESYMEIHAEDPNFVYFIYGTSGLTLNSADGELLYKSTVQNWLEKNDLETIKKVKPEHFGKMKDGVITFSEPKNVFVYLKTFDKPIAFGNTNGMLAIALPGHKIADYSSTITYSGRHSDVNFNDFAEISITLGPDVAKATYAMFPVGSMSEEAAVKAVVDGTVETQKIKISPDVKEPYDVKIPYKESGDYYVVVVSYDADGKVQATSVTKVSLKSSKDAMEAYKDIYKGLLTVSDPAADLGAKIFKSGKPALLLKQKLEVEAVLSQSTTDPTKYRITPFLNDGFPLDFKVNADNTVTVKGVDTGFKSKEGAAIQCTDLVSYNSALAGFPSKFDKDKSVISFNLIYHDTEGIFAAETEKFELDEAMAKAIAKSQLKAPAVNPGQLMRKNFVFGISQKYLVK